MRVSRALLRYPLIRFVGRRSVPKEIDHTPHVHAMSPTDELPQSFAQYRRAAQIHGPISRSSGAPASSPGALNSIHDLPLRLQYRSMSAQELECINSGGAEFAF